MTQSWSQGCASSSLKESNLCAGSLLQRIFKNPTHSLDTCRIYKTCCQIVRSFLIKSALYFKSDSSAFLKGFVPKRVTKSNTPSAKKSAYCTLQAFPSWYSGSKYPSVPPTSLAKVYGGLNVE